MRHAKGVPNPHHWSRQRCAGTPGRRHHSAMPDSTPAEAYQNGMLMEMHAEARPSAGSTGARRRVKQHSGAMTAHPQYPLTLPPTCPRKWDDLNVHCL